MRFVALAALLSAGCPPHVDGRPYPEPTVQQVVDRLAKARDALTSFKADSMMDYRLNNQRAKVEVLVMGTVGAKLRFAALSPAGGATLAEMACDGTNFMLVDDQNNCVLSGPCDARSIEQFFHLELAPDDFLHLALGTVPVIAPTGGTVTWDGAKGYERVELAAADGKQRLVIDTHGDHWDVIESELVGNDGKVRWSVENKDFKDQQGHRVPSKTWFKSPTEGNDVIVEWTQREVDVELDAKKFTMQLPQGLPMCGQKPPGAATGGNGSGGGSSTSSSHPSQTR